MTTCAGPKTDCDGLVCCARSSASCYPQFPCDALTWRQTTQTTAMNNGKGCLSRRHMPTAPTALINRIWISFTGPSALGFGSQQQLLLFRQGHPDMEECRGRGRPHWASGRKGQATVNWAQPRGRRIARQKEQLAPAHAMGSKRNFMNTKKQDESILY